MMTLILEATGTDKFVTVIDRLDTGKPDGEAKALTVSGEPWELTISSYEGTTTGHVYIDVARKKGGEAARHEKYPEEKNNPLELDDSYFPKEQESPAASAAA
jgi:hypothetical protein